MAGFIGASLLRAINRDLIVSWVNQRILKTRIDVAKVNAYVKTLEEIRIQMCSRFTEADKTINALKDHTRGHYPGKALPQLENHRLKAEAVSS